MMRSNPDVCFQVDQIISSSEWRSVVAWGTYEELAGEDAEQALEQLMRWTTDDAADEPLASGRSFRHLARQVLQYGVIYRIPLVERSGRFQQSLPSSMDWHWQQ